MPIDRKLLPSMLEGIAERIVSPVDVEDKHVLETAAAELRGLQQEIADAALGGCGSVLLAEALTEKSTKLRIDLAKAMYDVERKAGTINEVLTEQEILDAYWDQLDAIWPVLHAALGGQPNDTEEATMPDLSKVISHLENDGAQEYADAVREAAAPRTITLTADELASLRSGRGAVARG